MLKEEVEFRMMLVYCSDKKRKDLRREIGESKDSRNTGGVMDCNG